MPDRYVWYFPNDGVANMAKKTSCEDKDSVDLEYARLALDVFSAQAAVDSSKIFAVGFSQNALWTAVLAACFPEKILRFAQAGSGLITAGGAEPPGKEGHCTARSFAVWGEACVDIAPCNGLNGEPRCDFHPLYPAAYITPSLGSCNFIYTNDFLFTTQEAMYDAMVAGGHDSRYIEFTGGNHRWQAQKNAWVVSCLGIKEFCSVGCENDFKFCMLISNVNFQTCWVPGMYSNRRPTSCLPGCAPTWAMLILSDRPGRSLSSGGSFENWPDRHQATSTTTTLSTTTRDRNRCCLAATAPCMACWQQISFSDYCARAPESAGCPTSTAAGFSALTCDQLKWSKRVGNVCAASSTALDVDTTSDRCYEDRNQGMATAVCERAGARLCTVEEIETAVTVGTGCGYDTAMVWTSTWCGLGPKYFTANGGGSGERQCKRYDKARPVRCCADTDVTSQALRDAGTSTTTIPAVARKTCAELGWGAKVNGVCGEAYTGMVVSDGSDKCFNNKNFPDANAHCAKLGARLCTAAEIASGVGKSTGCSMDPQYVWTSTLCETDGYLGSTANGLTDCKSIDDYAPLKCCSDDLLSLSSASTQFALAAAGYSVGNRVEVLWDGVPYAATVISVHSTGEVDVEFEVDGTVSQYLSAQEYGLKLYEQQQAYRSRRAVGQWQPPPAADSARSAKIRSAKSAKAAHRAKEEKHGKKAGWW